MAKIAVYPGSFNPVHPGHINVMYQAAQIFDEVRVLVASNPQKSYSVPYYKRCWFINCMVKSNFPDDWIEKIDVDHTDGSLVNYCQENEINTVIRGIRNGMDLEYEKTQGLYNRLLMPKNSQLNYVFFTVPADLEQFSSTSIRQFIMYSTPEQLSNLYFYGNSHGELAQEVIKEIYKAYGGMNG
jgi:pantetheine-phosphate adenylyltransferase